MRYNKAIITGSGKLNSKDTAHHEASAQDDYTVNGSEETESTAQRLRKGRGTAS